jgi:hypothetical protein|tara:strand:- start:307 stop:624 length:318 start_codon:yes stop_codon:yes gene_type:complete
MKIFMKVSLILSMIILAGCAVGRSPVNNGWLITNVGGSTAVGPATSSSKQGESCATNILGIIATGDATAATAANNGGITNIQAVDYTTKGFLGLFATSCTIVTGE